MIIHVADPVNSTLNYIARHYLVEYDNIRNWFHRWGIS